MNHHIPFFTRHLIVLLAYSIMANNTIAQRIDKPYFQQEVNNVIVVTLNDESHILRGNIDISYKNNSPDTLTYIYFHLWPKAYSSDRSAFNKQQVENGDTKFYTADKNDWGNMDSISFSVNNIPAAMTPTEDVDVVKLLLPTPLMPGETIEIATPFKVIIPYTFSRLGHKGQSYQITQWYPKPAVYDENGWHPMPYLNQGEFYSEFGSYDVSITLPENYVVIATGDLQTPSEIAFMNKRAKDGVDSTYNEDEDPPSSSKMKTIRFTEDNVHDFAWFADKRWQLDIMDFQIAETGKKVTAYSAYFPWHKEGWVRSADYLRHATQEYSKLVGPYLFNTVKAVEGPLPAGGGMEYPTVTIIIPSDDSNTVRKVIIHEVGHNWFYGILANNERRYPWLDESINSFVEQIVDHSYVDHTRKEFFDYQGDLGLLQGQVERIIQPLDLPSEAYRSVNYGTDIYRGGANTVSWLAQYMGEDNFWKAMRDFYNRKKLQHIQPQDFYDAMKRHTDKDISWWYRDALSSSKLVDFSIDKITNESNTTSIQIQNKTGYPAPAIIELGVEADDSMKLLRKIVTEPFQGKKTITIDNKGNAYDIGMIANSVPDMNGYNHFYYNAKARHLKLSLLPAIPYSGKYLINAMPMIGYNYHDGFQLGGIVHNFFVSDRRFQLGIMPGYGFKSRKPIGAAFLSFKDYRQGKVHHVEYKLSGSSYGYRSSKLNMENNLTASYYKMTPEVNISFARPTARTPVYRDLTMKVHVIGEQDMNFTNAYTDSLYRPELGNTAWNAYAAMKYNYENLRTYNPYGYSIEAHGNHNFAKIMAEGNVRIDYHYKNSGLNIRAFVGRFLDFNASNYENNRYYLNATYTNYNDYLYDEVFIGRNINNHSVWSNQISMREGGLKIPTNMYNRPLGRSNQWLSSINLTSDIPFVPFVKLFADIATATDMSVYNPSGAKVLYDAGIELRLSPIAQIYIPILYSKDYRDYLRSTHPKMPWLHAISFSINFNEINWSNPLRSTMVRKLIK